MGSTGDAGAAFVAGRVDAAVVWEPWLSKGKSAPHGHLLIDSSKTPGLIIDTLAFRQDVVKNRPDDVRKVVRAIGQAVDYWRQNPKEATEIMTKGLGGWLKEPKDFEEALSGATLYGIAGEPAVHGDEGQARPDVPDRPGRDRLLAADRQARLAGGQGRGRHRSVVPGIAAP